MKVVISSMITHEVLKEVDYDGLLKMCNDNKEVCEDFLKYIRKYPDNTRLKQRWEVIDNDSILVVDDVNQ